MPLRIAQLKSNDEYRALNTAEEPSVEIDLEWFAGPSRIGERWGAPVVKYPKGPQVFPPDSCEANAEPEEPPEHLRPTGDFPHFWGINFGVLTRRSYEALHELIEPFVEFLPLESTDGEFIAFKVLRFVDALDGDMSVIDWYPQLEKDAGKPRLARAIKQYVFQEELLRGEVIFRIPQMPLHSRVFVTQRFIDRVNANNLVGFRFQYVWPPADPSIERQKFLAKHQRKKGK